MRRCSRLPLLFLTLLLLFAEAPATAQSRVDRPLEPPAVAAVESIRRGSLSTRRNLLTTVLVAGLVSAVGGAVMVIPDADDQAWRYAGINTAAFGVANAIIGGIALLGISSEEDFVLTPRGNESEARRAARLLRHAIADEHRESVGHAINLGLGVGYAAIGATAMLASQFDIDNSDRWLASGVAIAAQAAFLIVIDLWGMSASGTSQRRLLERLTAGG